MSRVKLGVVGCGAIAQVHHMPNLFELQELFDVTTVCDVSAGAATYVAQRFHVPKHVTDYRDLLAADVDAVLLCQSDPKTTVALAALDAGKHLFIEKPVCYSLEDMDAMIAAHQRAGTVAQTGYMKIFDPGYEYARQEIETMANIQFVQVNHLHPNNGLHVRQFDVRGFDDIPAAAMEERNSARDKTLKQAIGDVEPHVAKAFFGLSGSMIHDIYTMRHALGEPIRVVSTEIWSGGRAWSTTLEYADGFRAVASWIDLPDLWDFKETLEVYGDAKRVIVSYPTGFSRGILATVTVQGVDEHGTTYRHEPHIDWDSAFVRELEHFHDCIINGTPCRAPLAEARLDVSLIIDIIEAYKRGAAVDR
ncbi:MAG: Gfo/Idh/MocA family oxidoreductase [Caldilineaceae bacterium]|nr:Gfo/Idh/MocA family oxidoreductase [Caldilineaceae bacterium]